MFLPKLKNGQKIELILLKFPPQNIKCLEVSEKLKTAKKYLF